MNLCACKSVCVLSCFSCDQFFATLWTAARQTPLSIEFARQEYWSGLPCPPPGDLPYPGFEPTSFKSPALAEGFFTTSTTWEAWQYGSMTLVPFIYRLSALEGRCTLESEDLGLNLNPVTHYINDSTQFTPVSFNTALLWNGNTTYFRWWLWFSGISEQCECVLHIKALI